MATSLNASSTNGLIQTADASGVMQLQTANTVAVTITNVQDVVIQSAPLWQYAPAPTTKSAVATLSASEVSKGIIVTSGTTYTVTLPTGTQLDTYFTGVVSEAITNIGFDFSVVNTASGTITIAVGASGMSSLGTLTVLTGISGRFRLRRTAANTYVLYRLS
jgi:hypothetical protein